MCRVPKSETKRKLALKYKKKKNLFKNSRIKICPMYGGRVVRADIEQCGNSGGLLTPLENY